MTISHYTEKNLGFSLLVFESSIKNDILADKIIYGQTRENYLETNINGEKLNIAVEVIR